MNDWKHYIAKKNASWNVSVDKLFWDTKLYLNGDKISSN